jgi:VWFA-related protein
MTLRTIAIAALAVIIGTGAEVLRAQGTASSQHPLRVTTRLVQIAVLVQDKQGKPVTGLTKDDFVLLDNKKNQEIQLFSVDTNQVMPSAERPLPRDTYTNEIGQGGAPSNLTVILMDSFNTAYLDQAWARKQIVKLLLTIQPQDRVALYTLGSHLRVLHEFTSNASSLIEALTKYNGERAPDMDNGETGPTNLFNQQLVQLADDAGINENQAFAEDHSHLTAQAIRMVANHVGSLPGRKNLVWVSGAFPFSLETNNPERTPSGQKIPIATDVELVARALSDANMAIYPVDARGLVDPGLTGSGVHVIGKVDDSNFGTMQILAQRTGGRAYYNTNAIMGSIRQAIDDSRVTYELGFYPAGVNWDGSFHAIRVKVKRADVHVQAREGYFALPERVSTPEGRLGMISEAARSPLEATGVHMRVEIFPVVLFGQKSLRLTLAIDTEQLDLEREDEQWKGLVDVAFVQLDGKNQIAGTVPLSFHLALSPEEHEQMMKQGFSFARELPILSNSSEMRVIVRDDGNGKIGSVHIPLASYFSKKTN